MYFSLCTVFYVLYIYELFIEMYIELSIVYCLWLVLSPWGVSTVNTSAITELVSLLVCIMYKYGCGFHFSNIFDLKKIQVRNAVFVLNFCAMLKVFRKLYISRPTVVRLWSWL